MPEDQPDSHLTEAQTTNPLPLLTMNKHGIVTAVNPSLKDQAGFTQEDFLGHNIIEFLPADVNQGDIDELSERMRESLEARRSHKKSHADTIIDVRLPDGSSRTVVVAPKISKVRVGDYRRAELEITLTDVTELSLHATTDMLTNLPNKREILSSIAALESMARRDENSSTLIMVDVDHFKEKNDTFGHQVGDEVLINTAKRFSEWTTRKSEPVGRWGGEEFMAYVSKNSVRQAFVRALKLRKILTEKPIVTKEHTIPLSVSIGITNRAVYEKKTPVDMLTYQADLAMFAVKFAGRDGIGVYFSEEVYEDPVKDKEPYIVVFQPTQIDGQSGINVTIYPITDNVRKPDDLNNVPTLRYQIVAQKDDPAKIVFRNNVGEILESGSPRRVLHQLENTKGIPDTRWFDMLAQSTLDFDMSEFTSAPEP